MLEKPLTTQILVVSFVAIIATIGVYGIVDLIVRMDDMGYKLIQLSKAKKGVKYYLGTFLVKALPKVIKSLSVIGTIALLLVSGGIFIHNIEYLHHLLDGLPSILAELLLGLVVGFIALFLIILIKKIIKN